jgi:CO dehydrogenase maturation factor
VDERSRNTIVIIINLEELNMKKLAVCGKGGSGKSSIVALLANGIRERGYQVLVVDSDESNPGLHRMLGLEERPEALLELVGGKKLVFQAFSEDAEAPESILTREEIRTSDLPSQYLVQKDGIGLVNTGKILQSLEGCACPMGVLNREFLKRLFLEENELAVVDMEAGIEHFGRGVETSVDSVLVVVEPSFDSLELAEKINVLSMEVGVQNTWSILNKVPSEEIALQLADALKRKGMSVIGTISYDEGIFHSGLEGRPLDETNATSDIANVLDQLL